MSILDNVKAVAEVLQKADNIELYRQILDIQAEAMRLMEKIRALENDNHELKERFRIEENLKFDNDLYWLYKENNSKDGPFCSKCWDDNKKLIRVHSKLSETVYICPSCGTRVPRDDNLLLNPINWDRY